MSGDLDATSLVERLRAAGSVFAEEEAAVLRIAATDQTALDRLVERRLSGEPLEQVVGWVEVDGLRLTVMPGVFVPRQRTALLAREAIRVLPAEGVLVDVCCGTGVVASLVANRRRDVGVHACDIDPAAVRCAARNLRPWGGQVHQGDLFAALPVSLKGTVDVIVANAPYVPSARLRQLPREARDFEPRIALDGGQDGAQLQRRIAAEAVEWLAPGGWLLIETGGEVAVSTLSALSAGGFSASLVHDDDLSAHIAVGTR